MKFLIDLHVHSRFSGDTDSEPEESVMQAIKLNLDGLAFTEHYSYEASGFVEMLKEKYSGRIALFRGVEFSAAEGHCLVFGVNTDKLSIRHAPVKELIRIVNEKGGVVIPSHPYRIGNSLADKIETATGICALEGYNGCTMHAYNARAITTARALNLPYTGGSDAHRPQEVGLCYTEFEEAVTDEHFIDQLRTGNYQGVDKRKLRTGSFSL